VRERREEDCGEGYGFKTHTELLADTTARTVEACNTIMRLYWP